LPQYLKQSTRIGSYCLLLAMLAGCSSPAPKPLKLSSPPAAAQPTSHPAVSIAKQQLGTPYRYGGASPERGFDCSGLVYYSYKRVGIRAPRTTQTLYRSTFQVDPAAVREGDLLFFRIQGKVGHVGIYIGDDTFLHSPSSGKVVSYASLNNPYWKKRLIRVGRLF
jgi:cell wall-associated NlpC family hydrolase